MFKSLHENIFPEPGNYWGWITPDNKYVENKSSHMSTLLQFYNDPSSIHPKYIYADGFIKIISLGDRMIASLSPERLPAFKKWVKDNIDPRRIAMVSIEYFDKDQQKLKFYKNYRIRDFIKENTLLTESMNLYVQWADRNFQKTDTLMDISNLISRPMWNILEKEMTPEETEIFRRQGKSSETIVPDGAYDIDAPTGVINFYLAGIPKRFVIPILNKIKETLNSNNIKYGRFKANKSGMYKSYVIRIPITENPNEYKGPPELNLSNSNARVLYQDILGFESEDGTSYSFTVDELEDAIKPYIDAAGKLIPFTELPSDEQGDTGPRMIGGGRNLNQLYRYIERLQEVIKWCREHNYKYLYVV